MYKKNNVNNPHFNEKIHRIQFGKVSLNKNPKFKNDIINKLKQKNPKYFVYVSEAEMVGLYNNIQDLEYVIDDVLHGEFTELKPIKEILEHDYEIHELLTNETLSFMRVIVYHLTAFIFYRIFMFILAFLVFTKLMKLENKQALIGSGCILAAMVIYEIIEKLIIENMI